ncbi:hypothetical protein Leryth_019267 [Lithospermum erythrorhizon]|nr:hypothetical protein Leryth_019267 [Lithospermum erythrorhizon]
MIQSDFLSTKGETSWNLIKEAKFFQPEEIIGFTHLYARGLEAGPTELGVQSLLIMIVEDCGIGLIISLGFSFMLCRGKDPRETLRTLVENQPVYIHPTSALFQKTSRKFTLPRLV